MECAHYSAAQSADVLVLSEVHSQPGAAPDMPDHTVLFLPRQSALHSGHNLGGVAVAIRSASPRVASAVVVDACPLADVLCVRLELHARMRYLYVFAVYLPPIGQTRVCSCESVGCPRSHIDSGLAWLSDTAQRCMQDGDVAVLGDFNANLQRPAHPRSSVLRAMFLDNPHTHLHSVHPRSADGALVGTRLSSGGAWTVLDLCFVTSGLHAVCVVSVSASAVISDHCALSVTLHLVHDAATALPLYGDGAQWPPVHLRRMYRLDDRLLQPQYQLVLQGEVARAMPSLRRFVQDEVAPSVLATAVDSALLSALQHAQQAAGLSRTVRGAPAPALAPAVQLQRQIERLRRTIRRRSQHANNEQLCAVLRQHQDALCAQQHSMRAEQRRVQRHWQLQQQQLRQATLTRLWESNSVRQLAGSRHQLLTAHLARKSLPCRAQAATTRLAREVREWFDYLSAKYEPACRTGTAAATVYDQHRVQLRQQCVGATCDVPVTKDEVLVAIQRLHATSAAIGVPTSVVKLLVSHDIIDVVVACISRMLDVGTVPAELCIVRAVVLHKKGDREDKGNFRIIGVGTALSRVLQLVVLQRLLQYAAAPLAISTNQHGFVFSRSTEQCIFSVLSAVACATERGETATGVFLDIQGAFASTPHALILCRMRELGVPRYLWRFMDVWMRQQCMFVQIGRHASPLFPVNIGVVEGGPASPLQFVLVLNSLPRRLDAFVGVPGYGIRAGNTALVHKWFADDGTMWGIRPAAVQPLLDVCSDEAEVLCVLFNVGPSKTAALSQLPTGKAPRARARAQQLRHPPPQLMLGSEVVPFTDAYEYLGVWMHSSGYVASVRHHIQQLQPVCAAIIRQALSTGLRQLGLFHGLCVYTQFWKPRLTYCLGFYATVVDSRLQHVEEVVLKLMCGASNMPVVVMRSMLGIPSFHCVLQQQQVGMLLRVLASPPGDVQRVILCEMLRISSLKAAKTLWWSRVSATLADMDRLRLGGAAVDASGVMGGPASWLSSATALARFPDHDITADVAVLRKHYKHALMAAEQQRRHLEYMRSVVSLQEVEELVLSPNYAPFIVEPRSAVCQLRVQLRGGVRELFGAQYRHLDVCPWCHRDDGFTVPHLLRDCEAFEAERAQCWQAALQLGVQHGVMDTHNVSVYRHEWYLLTVGAAVSHTFCRLHLDADTHWARSDGTSATGHVRRRYGTYLALLRRTGTFLSSCVKQTASLLAQTYALLRHREPLNAPHTVALRWSAQQLSQLRSVPPPDVQAPQPQA